MSEKVGRTIKVAGPLVVAENMSGTRMYDVVRVSEQKLIGEVIELRNDLASIQVYEETGGIGVGEPVYLTGAPLSVELGPGLITSIFDGIQRPLAEIVKQAGDYIHRGIYIPGLSRTTKWHFVPTKSQGDSIVEGDIIGTVKETEIVVHKIIVPPGVFGVIEDIKEGDFTVTDIICIIKNESGENLELQMIQIWPVRVPRPYRSKHKPTIPLVTGQRILDTFFPVAKGGTACVPGPFGSGKTVIQHQLAKWCDAEIIVYVGCGERGNEMTDVLTEFPELIDPNSGRPLMERTVLIANTSNMPVAAREASVYTGVTIAEYFRDMGYSVALMADSTSRWAEAMREISGRLEEMPGEEGYPAYLGRRIAEFYERSGFVRTLGSDDRIGALSIIGAVSPPGGDLSDPVVQSTLRVVRVFWSLTAELAYQRHFPAISWLNSYSLYHDNLDPWFIENIGEEFVKHRNYALELLQKEAELEEIVRLVGAESLPEGDRLILEVAKSIREDYLQQNAFDINDAYCTSKKQKLLLDLILFFEGEAKRALDADIPFDKISYLPQRELIARAKYIKEDLVEKEYPEIEEKVKKAVDKLIIENK
jgi:V/A-type H+-transporting ATPase subunit A